MGFRICHTAISVLDLEKSQKFYEEALGLFPVRTIESEDGKMKLVFLGDGKGPHTIELMWRRDRKEPYDLGEKESHIAFRTADVEGAYERHKEMGCVLGEKNPRGMYFIADPDGYRLEILPEI